MEASIETANGDYGAEIAISDLDANESVYSIAAQLEIIAAYLWSIDQTLSEALKKREKGDA